MGTSVSLQPERKESSIVTSAARASALLPRPLISILTPFRRTTPSFSSEDGWRGPCARTDRDRRLRLLQALAMWAPLPPVPGPPTPHSPRLDNMSAVTYAVPMNPTDKPLVWLGGQVTTPPMSKEARLEAGYLLRLLQAGHLLAMPQSRPMPAIGKRCHELRIPD